MNAIEAKIREALQTQRYESHTIGGRWEESARRFPTLAAVGYETRVRGERLVDPLPQIPDLRRPDVYFDERFHALEYGWHLRHDEPSRPRDRVDDEMDRELAEQIEKSYDDWDSWKTACRIHPELIDQGRAAHEAGFPLEPPAEIIAADLAENNRYRRREKA